MIGSGELIVIALIAFLLFGSKNLSSIMKDIGKGVKEINKTKEEIKEEIKEELNNDTIEIVQNIKSIKDSIKNNLN
jgi:TatA/E family protein of Tat protein translocase